MRQEIIEIPSKVINFARRVYPDNPKRVVILLLELALSQELELGASVMSEDELVLEVFPNATTEFINTIVMWFVSNDTEFNILINRFGLTKVHYSFEQDDDVTFSNSPYLVLNIF